MLESVENVSRIKPEAEQVAEFKAALRAKLEEAIGILNAAKDAGYVLNFSIALDGFGRHAITTLTAVKPL